MTGALLWTIFLTVLCIGTAARPKNTSSSKNDGDIHVLLVAGSNGWWNYRHQADVAHAYQLMRKDGIPASNIIVMMYDDIANDPENPYPGKLFNVPHGPDVYEGLKVDYSGESVNPSNFLNVLQGEAKKVQGGNGRVIQSKPNDRIFVFFADHGATGLIAFPDDVLTVDDLSTALDNMHKKKSYSQLMFYLEACESGSMFDGVLKPKTDIYAVTASNPDESSWGTYCDTDMNLPCLADLFSVNWMIDSEKHNVDTETLMTQFKDVRAMTTLSHVMRYGDFNFTSEVVAMFEGEEETTTVKPPSSSPHTTSPFVEEQRKTSWPARDIELMHLQKLKQTANNALTSRVIGERIAKIHEDRRNIETVVNNIVANVLPNASDRKEMVEKRNPIKDIKCHDKVVKVFDSICIDVNKFDYALKYIYVLNNLCVKVGDSNKIINAMHTTCSTVGKQFL